MADKSSNLSLNLPVSTDKFDHDIFLRQNFQTIDTKLKANIVQEFTAIAGQTVFTLSNAYTMGKGEISVEVDGVKQKLGSGYNETTPTSITLLEGLSVGAKVKITIIGLSPGDDSRIDQINTQLTTNTSLLADIAKQYVTPLNYPLIVPEASDRPRLQRMLDDANTKGIRKVLFPPKQTFTMDGTALVPYSNMEIDLNGSTLFMLAGTYNVGISFICSRADSTGKPIMSPDYDSTMSMKQNIKIINGIIEGNANNVTCTYNGSTCSGIVLNRTQNVHIEDMIIRNLAGNTGGGYGIIAAYSQTVYIEKVTVERTDRQNICIWETLDAHINNVNLHYSYYRDNILISTNDILALQPSFCTVTNSKMRNSASGINGTEGQHLIRVAGAACAIIENNTLEAEAFDPSYILDGIYCVVTGSLHKNFIVVGNNRINGCTYGVRAENDSVNQTFNIKDNEINNCVNGVRLNLIAESAMVRGNKIRKTLTTPIYVNAVKHVIVDDNEIDGGSSQVSFTPINTLHFTNNKVRNITNGSYSVLIAGSPTQKPLIVNNTLESNVINDIRVLTDGICLANNANINSSTVSFNAMNNNSKNVNLGENGATASRPTFGLYLGKPYYDTTLNKPVWCKTIGKEVETLSITAAPTTSGNITVGLNGVNTNIPVTIGTAEVETLTIITPTSSSSGNVVISLDGVNSNVAISGGDTAGTIADKIRATTISGWTIGGTAGSQTVTFTSTTVGKRQPPAFNGTLVGVEGLMSITTFGVNADTANSVGDKVRNTLITGWANGGSQGSTSVTFTANTSGVMTAPTFSGGTTGVTGTITVTTVGATPVWVDATGTTV